MVSQFFSVGLIALLGAMSPGPDFAIVTKNTLLHSRKAGLLTILGVGAALIIHMTYCVLGLAAVIASSVFLFSLIKFIGAFYLIYLGFVSLITKQSPSRPMPVGEGMKKTQLSNVTAFRQGFLCNLLNPKATLFFLSLFTLLIHPDTPFMGMMIYAMEIVTVSMLWFCALAFFLSHARVKHYLNKIEKYIVKILGGFLIGFGVMLVLVRR